MDKFLEDSLSAASTHDLVELFESMVATVGFRYYAYHFLTRDFRKLEFDSSLRCYNLPNGWLELYVKRNYFRIDPIQLAAAQRSTPFYWEEVRTLDTQLQAQCEFFQALDAAGFGVGLSVPVFSKPGTFAYFCFGSGTDVFSLPQADLLRLQMICFLMHQRYDQLSNGHPRPALSKRETEVLTLLAAGRSNPEIAQHLRISIHTVDTLVKRCFVKLDAKSRLEAGLLAAARGIAVIASPCPAEAGRTCTCPVIDGCSASCSLVRKQTRIGEPETPSRKEPSGRRK